MLIILSFEVIINMMYVLYSFLGRRDYEEQ